MKKLFTKLSLLLGVLMLLGVSNASAWVVYYNTKGFYDSGKMTDTQSISTLYLQNWSARNAQVTTGAYGNSIGQTGWKGWNMAASPTNSNYKDPSNPTIIGYSSTSLVAPTFISFVVDIYDSTKPSYERTYSRDLINNGNGGSGTGTTGSNVYKAIFIDGGVYSYTTSGAYAPTSTTGVGNYLTWASDNKNSINFNGEQNISHALVNDSYTVTSSIAGLSSDVTLDITVTNGGTTGQASQNVDYTFVDNKLTFLKGGTYTVVANTPKKQFSLTNGTVEVSASSSVPLKVEVGVAKVIVGQIGVSSKLNSMGNVEWNPGLPVGKWQPMNASTNDSPFDNILAITYADDSSDVDLGLEVTITPKFTPVYQPDAWSASTGMPDWIWNQMIAMENTSNSYVDGYYVTPTITPGVSDEDIINYSFPCSGVYEVTVSSTNSGVSIENPTQEINVYPSINLYYSYTLNGVQITHDGLNLDDYRVVDNIITLPYDAETVKPNTDLEYRIFTPGVFLVDIAYKFYTYSSGETTNGGLINLRRNANNFTTYKPYLYFTLSKNGAVTPQTGQSWGDGAGSFIQISYSENVETGVEDIFIETAEEEAAEYYNLQGVKVANPEHGIFVKVQNGKATKVIL